MRGTVAATVLAVIVGLLVGLVLLDLAGIVLFAGASGIGLWEVLWRAALVAAGVTLIAVIVAHRRSGPR